MNIGIIAVVSVSSHRGEVDLDGKMQAGVAGQVKQLVMDLDDWHAGGQSDRLLDSHRVPIGMAGSFHQSATRWESRCALAK